MSLQNGVAKPRSAEKLDWLLKISRTYTNLNYSRDEDAEHASNTVSDHAMGAEQHFNFNTIMVIEEKPLLIFDYVKGESIATNILFSQAALFLSGRAINVICEKTFSKKDVNDFFLKTFYDRFFVFFLTRTYTWWSLSLLVRASKAHPSYFKNTIKILLLDRDIRTGILEDFVTHISSDECAELMNLVREMELSPEIFGRIASILCIIYKKINQTDTTFAFLQSILETFSDDSKRNRTFGKLMLHFVQNISGRDIVFRDVKTMVERHCTPYKTLCMAVLDKYLNDMIALQANLVDEGPRFVIPRPSDRFEL